MIYFKTILKDFRDEKYVNEAIICCWIEGRNSLNRQ